ncbi:MAG TPA: hypothetical protein HA232_04330 [Methanocellales archaeon]|nr:hypothetical protein [Methanocellales archaeon]
MKYHMNKNVKISLMLVTLVVVALLTALWATTYSPHSPLLGTRRSPPPTPIKDMELYYTLNTVISSINVTILIFLLITYISIYRKVNSEFTIGLMIFSMVLLFYALTSNPLIYQMFGFRASGLGPFAMLPNLFTCGALAILLYLSAKY